mmetsp:Transcript_73616/g.153582  ORF Transcript_73616/g.153582 Transcript_73616/m.153582 type:complete len:90 (-) Transcript_73616:58-327(-)
MRTHIPLSLSLSLAPLSLYYLSLSLFAERLATTVATSLVLHDPQEEETSRRSSMMEGLRCKPAAAGLFRLSCQHTHTHTHLTSWCGSHN